MKDSKINSRDCKDFITTMFNHCGLKESHARQWANGLVETSLLGIDSHGIRMLDRYVKHLDDGGISVNFEPHFIREKGAIGVLDGCNSSGHLGAFHTTSVAASKAKTMGIGAVSLINTNHVGACALYAAQLAREGCVGMCFAVTIAGIAPWGGKKSMLGINPVAVGFPVKNKPDFVLDISTSVTAMGKITRAADVGEAIPEGWALDADGKITTDPNKVNSGSLYPMGEHKGYGLSMAIEAISALLSNGAPSMNVMSWIANSDQSMGASFMAIALDIEAFSNLDSFQERTEEWLTTITTSPKKDGVSRIYYPGERSGEEKAIREKQGIPVDSYTREMLNTLAQRFNLDQLI